MCFDPVSLGALAIGTGASIGGGMLTRGAQAEQQQQQMNENLASAGVRNQMLLNFLNQQRKYQDQNSAAFKPITAAIDPTTFRAAQATDTANRTNAGTTAINDFTGAAPAVATTGTDPNNQVQAEIARRSGVETGKSLRDVGNEAKLKGFGDVFGDLGLTTNDAARKIDTTNSFARTDASLLPEQQQLAAAPFSQPVPQTGSALGSILSGVGNIAATFGGSRAGASGPTNLGNVFSNLSFNPWGQTGGIRGAN
jgi:hypothetical protein